MYQFVVLLVLGISSTVVSADQQVLSVHQEAPRHALFYRETPQTQQQSQLSNITSLAYTSQDASNNSVASQRLHSAVGHHHHPPNCPDHPHHRPPPNYPPSPPRCGGVFPGTRSVLLSPNFPGPYPAYAECTYNVIPVSPISGEACFQVRFTHLALRWSHNCQLDWIQIDKGPRLCGGITGDRYYRTSPRGLIVEFHSGVTPGPHGSGFSLVVTQLPCHIFGQPEPPHKPPHQPNPPYYPPYQPNPPPYRPPQPYPPHQPHYPPFKPSQPHPPLVHHPQYPGHQCPPDRPIHPPPIHKPHKPPPDDDLWWRWLWVLKCEWKGADNLPPGRCPVPRPPVPGPRPLVPGPHPPPPNAGCDRFVSSPQFSIDSDEWLPRYPPNHGPWNCQFTIRKAGPEACEVQLVLVGVSLRCGTEYLLVGGERVCGEQPLRQMSIDFRGSDVKIVYQNLAVGDSSRHGRFEIRGYQNFDCEPFILDVTPAKKLLEDPPTTTEISPINPRGMDMTPIKKSEEISTPAKKLPIYIHTD